MIKNIKKPKLTLFSSFNEPSLKGKIYNGQALEFLSKIESNKAGIVFLDPPFNIGKDYGNGKHADKRPKEEYLNWLYDLIKESERVLNKGGALYIYHLPSIASQLTCTLNEILEFRHWIAVSMKNTFVRGKRLYPAHYALLYYTKGKPLNFNRPKLQPVKCRKCNADIKDYGGYKHIIDKKGINLSDFWDDISPVRHNSKKSRNANELPLKFMERIISISGAQDEIYIDPFVGSGVGALAAKNAGMYFIVNDLEKEFCRITLNRINNSLNE